MLDLLKQEPLLRDDKEQVSTHELVLLDDCDFHLWHTYSMSL